MESPPIEVSRPTDQVRVSTPQDGVHLFKHMKPPVFRGEDRDRNKDSVITFLQKWRDVHDLRKPDESVKILEASLTLDGKAYKWWMSLDYTSRPTTGDEFERAFRKEFLPENEKERNWTAWDQCNMEGLTLTQYVSKYRDVILKLEGLDDFQKCRGFVRGLDKEYRIKVKTQNPMTLEEVVKSDRSLMICLTRKVLLRAIGEVQPLPILLRMVRGRHVHVLVRVLRSQGTTHSGRVCTCQEGETMLPVFIC